MKTPHSTHRPALGLLLAAAALPLTPLMAQDTAAPQNPPVADPAPPVGVAPAPLRTDPPIIVTPLPTVTPLPIRTPTPAAQSPAPAARAETPAARPARAAARAAARPRVPAPARAASPVRAAVTPASAPAVIAEAPVVEIAPIAPIAPEPPLAPAEAAAPVETQGGGDAPVWPWLLAGALLIGALALLLRRRRAAPVRDEERVEQPAVLAEAEPSMAAPLAAAPAAALVEEPAGRPWLELQMRPVRAGVSGDDARVEFELIVDNRGSAPARDVRVSTWMFAAGSSSEMEDRLIERGADAGPADVTIDAGQGKRIQLTVALPTAGMAGDAVLPVVVADARYRLPDGSEGRTSASFAVGVPDGADLAHFAIDHPSGMHEDVEARSHGEPQRA